MTKATYKPCWLKGCKCLHMQARLAWRCVVSNRVMQPATHSWVHSKSLLIWIPVQTVCAHNTEVPLLWQHVTACDSMWRALAMCTPVGSYMSVCAQISRQSQSAPFSFVTAPQGKPAAVSQTAWLSKLAGPWNDSIAHRNVNHSKVSNHSNQGWSN